MNKFLIVTSLLCFLSCTNDNTKKLRKSNDPGNVRNKKEKPGPQVKDGAGRTKKITELKRQIAGVWATEGMENAAFRIDAGEIFYPEALRSYPYTLRGDSIKIRYDDFVGTYLVKMRGGDTLVLVDREEHIYYRFKK